MEKTFLQVRTDTKDKEQASAILEELGTNLSSVVNMLLKQIILTKSIPFEIKFFVYTHLKNRFLKSVLLWQWNKCR